MERSERGHLPKNSILAQGKALQFQGPAPEFKLSSQLFGEG